MIALRRTAAAVRRLEDTTSDASRGRGRLRRAGRGAMLGAASSMVLVAGAHREPTPVLADSGADGGLFAATNGDRSSNGVGPLQDLGILQSIGESRPYSCGGITVAGRAVDMIQRNYFSHVIAGCGQNVFSMMVAAGVSWTSAGENIGWSSGSGSAAASVGWINTAFMNSPSHRDNILNPAFTGMGVGSDWTAGPWTGAAAAGPNVSMFAELFVQQGQAAPPPAPSPPPAPAPTPRPVSSPPPSPAPTFAHNDPVPTASLPPAAVEPTPTATPAPTPFVPPAALRGPVTPAPTDVVASLAPSDSGGLGDVVEGALARILLP